ncbi:hypothetical protein [Klebsiella quasipneumoniae]|nr:hypothetical protein [Klebsiella quasipneumoniae]
MEQYLYLDAFFHQEVRVVIMVMVMVMDLVVVISKDHILAN